MGGTEEDMFHKDELEVREESLTRPSEALAVMDKLELVGESGQAGTYRCRCATVKGAGGEKLLLCGRAISGDSEPRVQMRSKESEDKLECTGESTNTHHCV